MKSASTIAAIATVLALASIPAHVDAHGGMTSPESRAIRTMKLAIASTFGHPINMRADYTNGKGGDCINFTPDTNLQSIPVGSSKIKMRANDGANHVGQCSVFLIDPQDKNKKLQVGQMKDCMRSLHPGPGNKGDQPIPAEMTIDVPSSGLPCRDGHCVLQFAWEAQHVSPSEFYNNCADVKIAGTSSGGGGNNSGGNPPASPPASTTKPSTPSMTPKPAATAAPPASGSSGKYRGSNADMTQWCNWNCPNFCPSDLCKEA